MKIAVASEGKMVSEHFGHCEGFTFFEIEDKQIKEKFYFANPGHKRGFLPVFLQEKGADLVIAGGMGSGAIDHFKDKGIEIISGVHGEIEDAVKKYLKGELKSTDAVCNEHQYRHSCECECED
ncbi:MAG: NifB/NifX family molybdenum-iron cluster-binding protein [Bacillota bacterium]|jgi:predicted Fe-Mo cluster-binding NifX family protein